MGGHRSVSRRRWRAIRLLTENGNKRVSSSRRFSKKKKQITHSFKITYFGRYRAIHSWCISTLRLHCVTRHPLLNETRRRLLPPPSTIPSISAFYSFQNLITFFLLILQNLFLPACSLNRKKKLYHWDFCVVESWANYYHGISPFLLSVHYFSLVVRLPPPFFLISSASSLPVVSFSCCSTTSKWIISFPLLVAE